MAKPRHGELYINPDNRDISIWDDDKGEWLHLSDGEFLDRKLNYKRPPGQSKYFPKYPQPDLLCIGCNLPYYDCVCEEEEEVFPFDITLEDELFEI